ncbi:YciI family protein [Longispora urticae]
MEFFVYCRDRSGSGALKAGTTEAHWSFMDGFADALIARGPTLTGDREHSTGSVHLADLADAAAAHRFVYEEPYLLAGVFDEVLIRRWRNELGRTMWEFTGGGGGERFLILGHGAAGQSEPAPPAGTDGLIAYGPLLSEDGAEWLGTAVLAELPDRAAAEALLAPDAARYDTIEVHPWEPGGRR